MIKFVKAQKASRCTICGLKVRDFYRIIADKKDLDVCKGCFQNLYTEIGETLTPKSLENILKKDNRVIKEKF